jgi:hypothetical protein
VVVYRVPIVDGAVPPTRVDLGAPEVEGNDHVPTRVFPPKSDRNNAVDLANLPWLKYPTSVEECDDILNGIAIALERTALSNAYWLSLRTYVTEMRKRLLDRRVAA